MNELKRIERKSLLKGGALLAGVWLIPEDLKAEVFKEGETLTDSLYVYKKSIQSWDQPILSALQAGVAAPSPHNTQPWKFQLAGEREAYLYLDPERLLPETDPPARQIFIGQGTFLEMARIGSSLMGIQVEYHLFPQGYFPEILQGKCPIAKILATPMGDSGKVVQVLAQAIPLRMTDRTSYETDPLSLQIQKELEQAGKHFHSHLSFVDPSQLSSLKEKVKEAYRIETDTYKKHEETRKWFRYNDEEIYSRRDGISLRANGMTGFQYWMARTFFLTSGEESWHSEQNKNFGIEKFNSAIEATPAFAMLVTETNKPEDRVRTGVDYIRFQLSAALLGIVMQPVSQILQEYPEMEKEKSAFEKQMGVSSPSKIQMLLRVGKGKSNFHAPRRALGEFYTSI